MPLQCSDQTQNKNIKCEQYFTNIQHDYILVCRNNQVIATGNSSFTNPKLEKVKLSFIPKIIDKSNFPIRIENKQIFADQICGRQQDFLSIPRKKLNQFHAKSPAFLFNPDPVHNVSFQTDFIYSTLKKIQTVKAHQIVKIAQSKSFIFSCLLAVFIFTCLLSLCFCPALFMSMLQCILKCILQFCAYLMEKIVKLLSLIH